MLQRIALSQLTEHPQNPRLEPNEEIVARLSTMISSAGSFDDAHALIVRSLNGCGYQIVSGHHRALAAGRAGLAEVPCWVREMSDEDAFMALVLENTQSELHALEEGLHALNSGMSQRAYADRTGKSQQSVSIRTMAARVTTRVVKEHALAFAGEPSWFTGLSPTWHALNGTDPGTPFPVPNEGIALDVRHVWRCLAEIHAAPEWLWPALTAWASSGSGKTVDATRKLVARIKDAPEPPAWADKDAIASAVVNGTISIGKTPTAKLVEDVAVTDEDIRSEMMEELAAERPATASAALTVCKEFAAKQSERDAEKREKEIAERKAKEAAEARVARLRESVSLEEWKTLDQAERESLLETDHDGGGFNKQQSDAIEWAQFSWNPITGCQHDCPYCYARDIATNSRYAKGFPNGFTPTIRPRSIKAPSNQKVPGDAAFDVRFKNVFTCSMADMFGRWVPDEWIQAILDEQRQCPQWNFLMLTKFPKRMAEFDIPANAWMGTTVDLQARVANAEAAFAKVNCAVKWLSVEPMLEPLRFSRLDLFDLVVIGGATSSSKTPEWKPPFPWIADLVAQAREAGTKVYFKTNLLGNRILEMPEGMPVEADAMTAPAVFHYLKAHNETPKP